MDDDEQEQLLAHLGASRPGGRTYSPEQPDGDQADGSNLPAYRKKAFVCPHCRVVAHQKWWEACTLAYDDQRGRTSQGPSPARTMFSHCQHCQGFAFWVEKKLVFPATGTAPMPAVDMPDDVKADYLEARDVFDKSPRSAGGLLRIGFEKLLKHVGATKSNPNEAIGELVKNGLALGSEQRALDVMRVFGNQAVHNGFVKMEDQPATVGFLFNLLNYIVEQMITRRKEIDTMFAALPPDKIAGIEKRDGSK